MTMHLSRRALVRLVSFALALCLVLGVWLGMAKAETVLTERKLEYGYLRALSSLSDGLADMDSDLCRLRYTNSPELLSHMAARLWRTSALCKEDLAALALDSETLGDVNRYLAQAGDYCMALARDFAAGSSLTDETETVLSDLQAYGQQVLTDVLVLQDAVQTGAVRLCRYDGGLAGMNRAAEAGAEAEEPTDTLPAYPTLLYDGPFSDHMQSRSSVFTERFRALSTDELRTRAAGLLGVLPQALESDGGEESVLPCDTFRCQDARIALTRQGGFLCYYRKPRQVTEARLSVAEGIERAAAFALSAGFDGMISSYYEVADNLLTVQLVYRDGEVVCYPDQIKVGVALDNGEILRCDTRTYLMNHQSHRSLPTPVLSAEEAAEKISPALTPGKTRLCIIPSEGLAERFCYEVNAAAPDGTNLLVYLNAETGKEEKILILSVTENGQLTV